MEGEKKEIDSLIRERGEEDDSPVRGSHLNRWSEGVVNGGSPSLLEPLPEAAMRFGLMEAASCNDALGSRPDWLEPC